MKQRYFLTFCFITWSLLSFGQKKKEKDSIIDDSYSFKTCIKIAPLSPFMKEIGPSFRMGIEYRVKDRISIYNELGVFAMKSQGMSGSMELKFYENGAKRLGGTFWSIEFFCKSQFFHLRDDLGGTSVTYTLNKNVQSLTFKVGHTIIARRGFVFEIFTGLGARFSQNRNSLTRNLDALLPGNKNYPQILYKREGELTFLNFQFGCRIGFRLK